jgi:hypothetical protein
MAWPWIIVPIVTYFLSIATGGLGALLLPFWPFWEPRGFAHWLFKGGGDPAARLAIMAHLVAWIVWTIAFSLRKRVAYSTLVLVWQLVVPYCILTIGWIFLRYGFMNRVQWH